MNVKDFYETKDYLGILMFVAKKDYLFADKLLVLTFRNEIAMRDVYDIYFFAKNYWDINEDLIKERTGKTIKDYLKDCVLFIENINKTNILQGLRKIIDNEKEKTWIKNYLKTETIFILNNYLSVLK